jgi:hypothetical protein
MILTRNLNLIPTRENKTRVFPRREDNASPARIEGSHQLRVGRRKVFTFTHPSMRDPSLALGMTEGGRPQSAVL